jgi:hypothetical protein
MLQLVSVCDGGDPVALTVTPPPLLLIALTVAVCRSLLIAMLNFAGVLLVLGA